MPKVISIPGLGNVEFPDAMQDSAIHAVLKSTLPAAPGWKWSGATPYKTPLSVQEEEKFRTWVTQNRVPFNDSAKSDYDMRGYWKDIAAGGSASGTQMKSDGLHFPDTYKTPYHQSASAESMYMPSDAPTWQGTDSDGWKLVDKTGKVVYDESKLKILSPQK